MLKILLHIEKLLQRWYPFQRIYNAKWKKKPALCSLEALEQPPNCLLLCSFTCFSLCYILANDLAQNCFTDLGFLSAIGFSSKGWLLLQKKWKKKEKFWYNGKKSPPNIFFPMKGGISIRNYLGNPIKMVPMLYNDDFWHKLVVFIVKKVNGKKVEIFYPHFQY